MPSKHNPPTVSSSSGSSSEEGDDVEASHGDEEEEEEENTPLKPQQQSSKKFNLNSNPNPSSTVSKSKPDRDLGSSGEEDDESSGEYESDSDVPLTQNQNSSSVPLDVKPISSKPMAENLKSKKSSVEASPVVALASVKRKPENNDEKDGRKDQKKKKVSDLVEEDEKKSGDEKKLFQRFWTDEDEIVILKGMVNFKKKGIDPSTQVNSFFDTIKGSLHTDVSKTQVQSKIRTIKRKYQNALKKVKPGADPENLKPHEEKVYHLCKKVWPEGFGKDDDGEGKSVETIVGGVDSKKTPIKKVSDGGAAASSSPSVKVTALPSKVPAAAPAVVMNNENHQITSSSEYAYLSGSTVVSNVGSTLIPPPGLGEIVSKKGWDVIGSSKAKEFDDKWKNLIIAETKIYLQRIDLVREQTQAMLDMLESSN